MLHELKVEGKSIRTIVRVKI